MRLCKHCEAPIPYARLVALPDTRTCLSCSEEEPLRGWLVWEHKTAPAFQVVSAKQHDELKSNDRRGMKTAAKVENRNPVSVGMSRVGRDTRVDGSVVNHTPSRCHPSQPRVSASGHCLSCAMRWYRLRAK